MKKKIFNYKNQINKKKILVEYNALYDSHIIYSYLAENLAKKYNSEINSYSLKFDNSFFEKKTKSFIKNHFYFSYRKVYKSFGATTHIIPKKIASEKKNLKEKNFK